MQATLNGKNLIDGPKFSQWLFFYTQQEIGGYAIGGV
jgi:hypothetical protein